MTLEEIFQTNPELLNAPEVQKLIAYTQEQHARTYGLVKDLQTTHLQITSLVFNSDQFLIKGTPAAETIQKIIELI